MPSSPGSVETIGKYHVMRPLSEGRGLGGRLYLADDPDAAFDERAFLIKLLDVRGLERAKVLRELRQVRRLDHDAVAPLVEYFEHGRQLAVVFETFEGLWLDQIMDALEQRDERLPLPVICYLGARIAGAVAAAHSRADDQGRVQHLSHGRLGPDHVHVSWQGVVRVFGIGLAAALGEVERGPRARGSAAPEQQRVGLAAGAQADVYGVGAMVWSLLSGQQAAPDQPLGKVAKVRDGVPEPVATGVDLAVQRAISARRINCQQLAERFDQAAAADGVEELRKSMAGLRSAQPASEAGPSPAPGPSAAVDDEADLARTTVPRPGPRSAADASDDEVTARPTAPRPRPSAPEADGASGMSVAQRIGARKAAPGGPDGTGDAPEAPTIPAKSSDPPDLEGKPGRASLPAVHDESVVERISSLFDDIEAAPPGDAEPSEPAADGEAEAGAEPATDATEALPVATSSGAGDPAPPTPDDVEPSPEDELDRPMAKPLAAPAGVPATGPTGPLGVAGTAPAAPVPEAPGSTRRGVSLGVAVLLALGVGAVGFAAAWWLKPAGVSPTPLAATASSVSRPSPTASVAGPAATAILSAPAPPVSAAPTGEVDAGPVDAGATEEEPAASPAVDEPSDAGDGSELLSYEGYLTVRSRISADVYVQGLHLGSTNRKLKSRCRQRFIRLRDPSSGQWLTQGDAVRIVCMSSTTVTIDPPAP